MTLLAAVAGSGAQAGTTSSTLTITLRISANPGSCGIGTTGAAGSSPINVSLPSQTPSNVATSLSNAYAGSEGIGAFCTTTFVVSADGGLTAPTVYTDTNAVSRYLYQNATSTSANKFKYNLTIGPNVPTSITGSATAPTWQGSNATNCTVAYTGTVAGTGGTFGSGNVGCYKSPAITTGTNGTGTSVYIPWGYYIDAPNGWTPQGDYSDVVNLTLNY